MDFSQLQLESNNLVRKKVGGAVVAPPPIPEPGHKIPISNYKQIGQFCDFCNDVTAHVYSMEKKKLRCLKCRTTKQY